jgi:hypothetical protein
MLTLEHGSLNLVTPAHPPQQDNADEEAQMFKRICLLLALHPDLKHRTKACHQSTFFPFQEKHKLQLYGEGNVSSQEISLPLPRW